MRVTSKKLVMIIFGLFIFKISIADTLRDDQMKKKNRAPAQAVSQIKLVK